MPIWGTIFKGAGEILKPLSEIVDSVTTNKEEKAEIELKIKDAVFKYEAELEKLVNEREQQLLNDVANARSMNMKAMENQDSFVRRFQYYLAALYVLATFGFYAVLLTCDMSRTQETLIHMILGALIANSGQILQFFFGSTRGAESKNETIKNLSRP